MSSKEKLLASAQKNLQKNQIAKAIRDYHQIVDLDPKDFRNRQKLAELYCRAKMDTEALGEYGGVAKYYADNGFYLKAIAVYKQMQRLDPEQIDVCHRLAELNVKQGLIGNALAEYRNLVTLFEKKKQHSDAIGVLQKMAELEPENLNFHVRIAELYAQAGLREKAREEFAQVLDLLRDAGDFTQVVKLYELFMPIFPNDLGMKVGFAEALIRKGEIEKGLQLLKALLHDSPDNSQILMALALGYRGNEDFENERLTWQHLLKQAPQDLALRESYIRACLDGGEHHRALESLEEWREAFCESGQGPLLHVFYEDLLRALPDNELVRDALSIVCKHTGYVGGVEETPEAVSVQQPLAQMPPSLALEDSGTDAEGSAMPAPDASVPSSGEPELAAEQIRYEPEPGGAEEIPLGFLEEATELIQPLNAMQTADGSTELVQDAIDLDADAEEMELELELEIDEPLLALEVQQDKSTLDDRGGEPANPGAEDRTAAVDIPVPPDADAEEVEAEEILEELEELEPEEALEDIEPEETLDELELVAESGSPCSLAPETDDQTMPDSENLGTELRDLLSGLESFPGPTVTARDELEEAEFYLQQGLLDDAERLCRQILDSDPGCAEAQRKLADLAALRQETVAAPGARIHSELPGVTSDKETAWAYEEMEGQNEAGRLSLDGVVDGFKQNLETQNDAEDTESHYNLGIAYKEMGLLDDAVAEFDKAMKNPGRLVDSLTLKGTCLFEKGVFEQAEEVFKSGLVFPGVTEAERISLHYEMGLLYEAWGRPLEALDSFQSAADADLFFRNVGDKIETIRKTLGLDANAGNDDPDVKGNKNRVSYI